MQMQDGGSGVNWRCRLIKISPWALCSRKSGIKKDAFYSNCFLFGIWTNAAIGSRQKSIIDWSYNLSKWPSLLTVQEWQSCTLTGSSETIGKRTTCSLATGSSSITRAPEEVGFRLGHDPRLDAQCLFVFGRSMCLWSSPDRFPATCRWCRCGFRTNDFKILFRWFDVLRFDRSAWRALLRFCRSSLINCFLRCR